MLVVDKHPTGAEPEGDEGVCVRGRAGDLEGIQVCCKKRKRFARNSSVLQGNQALCKEVKRFARNVSVL
jgi:hypothetical protein